MPRSWWTRRLSSGSPRRPRACSKTTRSATAWSARGPGAIGCFTWQRAARLTLDSRARRRRPARDGDRTGTGCAGHRGGRPAGHPRRAAPRPRYAASSLLGLLGIALVTRHLGVVEFGRFQTVIALITVVGTVTDAGMAALGLREYAQRTGPDRDALMRSLLGLRIALTLAGGVVAVAAGVAVGYDSTLLADTALAAVGLALTVVYTTLTIPLAADLRNLPVTLLDVGRQALTTAYLRRAGRGRSRAGGVPRGHDPGRAGPGGGNRRACPGPHLDAQLGPRCLVAAAQGRGRLRRGYGRGHGLPLRRADPGGRGHRRPGDRPLRGLVSDLRGGGRHPRAADHGRVSAALRAARDDAGRLGYALQGSRTPRSSSGSARRWASGWVRRRSSP